MQDKHLSNVSPEAPTVVSDAAQPEQTEAAPINAVLRQALPRLRDIALYAALVGPIVVEQGQLTPLSLGHGGGW